MQATFPAFDYFSLRAQKKARNRTSAQSTSATRNCWTTCPSKCNKLRPSLRVHNRPHRTLPSSWRQLGRVNQQRARFNAGLASVVEVAAAESLLVQAEGDDVFARLNVWRAYAAHGDLSSFVSQLNRP